MLCAISPDRMMTRHSALIIFNPSNPHSDIYISPSALSSHSKSNLPFKSLSWDHENFLNEIVNCIQFLRSLPSNSHVILDFVSDFNFSNSTVDDAIMALLLTLETLIKIQKFEFNWITINSPKAETIQNDLDLINLQSQKSTWKEFFPFINFVHGSFDSQKNILTIPNIIQLPLIGSVSINSISFLYHILSASNPTTNANFHGICRKELINGFLDDENIININLESLPATFPPKILNPINYECDGILYEIVTEISKENFFTMMIFLEMSEKLIYFVESVFVSTVKSLIPLFSPKIITNSNLIAAPSSTVNNKWLDRSFSLSDWTSEDSSIDEDLLKKNNKLKLKKLILLSLRRIGIKKTDKQFLNVWKHLYCGCLFSLRKELNSEDISQSILLKTIKDNIKFLNIS